MGPDYSTEQENQESVNDGNREAETPDTARNIDDKSLKSENLQKISDEMQSEDENESVKCFDHYIINTRNRNNYLLNSKKSEFICKEYGCSYNEVSGRTKFSVKYKPSERKVFIKMPVMYVNGAVLNDGSDKSIAPREPVGSKSSEVPPDFAKAYEDSITRVWNNKYKFYLDANEYLPYDESCDNWGRITPVEVDVSVRKYDEMEDCDRKYDERDAYKVYYVDRADYRCVTGPSQVVFSSRAYDKREADMKGQGQNVFAHEFGHQIGLGDEYVIDDTAIDENGKEYKHVYWDAKLKVYDRKKNAVDVHDLANISTLKHKDVIYDVRKGKDKKGEDFYYLVHDNAIVNHALDGTYTRHTQMVAYEFGEEYANKNATMYDDTENSLGLETSIMNDGNDIKPHHYITLKKGMVNAIQHDSNGNGYGNTPSQNAPNMEEDWEIKK